MVWNLPMNCEIGLKTFSIKLFPIFHSNQGLAFTCSNTFCKVTYSLCLLDSKCFFAEIFSLIPFSIWVFDFMCQHNPSLKYHLPLQTYLSISQFFQFGAWLFSTPLQSQTSRCPELHLATGYRAWSWSDMGVQRWRSSYHVHNPWQFH
jgi:hypothetical protein